MSNLKTLTLTWIRQTVENTKLYTTFIGSDQHLLAHCMFSIDGAKQEKQLRNVETKGQHVSNIDPLEKGYGLADQIKTDGYKTRNWINIGWDKLL